MIELRYQLDLSQELYDDVAAFVAQHEMTVEELLEAFFREIHAERTLNPLLHILSLETLARMKESEADIAAGRRTTLTFEEFNTWMNDVGEDKKPQS